MLPADPTGAEPLSVSRNTVPDKYRGVAVATVDQPLDATSLTRHLLGKAAYRRTRFVVARNREQTAIARVWRAEPKPLFAPITRVQVLATPAECAYVHCPDVDTAIPSALAHAAVSAAPGSRAVAVQGRYEHVSFIIDPAPLRLTVHELVPPEPPKLVDQARRILGVRDDLPPIELVPDIVRLADLAAARTRARYLVPCRGSGFDPPHAETCYLDEHPPQQPWTMIGCERSQQIHQAFYGHRAAEQLDTCPRHRPPAAGPLLTKCCMLEGRIRARDGQAIVPWGASLSQVERALRALAHAWEPTWAPV
jgi:hypothetical protein